MSDNAIKLIPLLVENLLEIGDLKNIEPYLIKKIRSNKYKSIIGNEDTLDVVFTEVPDKLYSNIKFAPIFNRNKITKFYNLGYSIGGISTQAKRSNIQELLRIVATLGKVFIDFINSNSDCAIMIFEENKDETLGFTEGQKSPLYRAAISQNLPTGYISGPVEFSGVSGIIIAPK